MIRRRLIEGLAADAVRRARVTRPPVPVEAIARQANLKIRLEPFRGDSEMSGCIVRQPETGAGTIGVNSRHHENRQRFTIAHEIGHFLLHKGEEVIVDRNFRVNISARDRRSETGESVDEIEANCFAAALLMPEEFIRKDMGEVMFDAADDDRIRVMAKKYKVSQQAMTIRLVNLGYLQT